MWLEGWGEIVSVVRGVGRESKCGWRGGVR